ncbi:MAG: nucleotidyltransferase [Deltaproteobacteria bacterium]|nr:nucleotidyltransferase [Deltaproteobacteria bacterium]
MWGFKRFTHDVDFAIIFENETQAQDFVGYLKSQPQYKIQALSFISLEKIPDFIRLHVNQVPVDFLVANTEFLAEAVHRAVEKKIGGYFIKVATPEDLLVFKLLADRPHDREDVNAILAYHPQMDWSYIEKWCKVWEIQDRFNKIHKPSLP